MSCGYDPFKWADEPYEDIEEYQKQFKEDAKKIIEEMEIWNSQQKMSP